MVLTQVRGRDRRTKITRRVLARIPAIAGTREERGPLRSVNLALKLNLLIATVEHTCRLLLVHGITDYSLTFYSRIALIEALTPVFEEGVP